MTPERIVVGSPLHSEIRSWVSSQHGCDGVVSALLIDESISGRGNGAEKNVPAVRYESAAEGRIEITLLRHGPRQNLFHTAIRVFRVQAVCQGKFDLCRIGDDLRLVKANNSFKLIHAGDMTEYDP